MTTSYSPLDVSEHPRGERRVHWSEQLESVEELKELELTERGSDDDEEVEIYLQKSSSGSEEEQLDIEVDSPLFERLKSLAKLAAPVITSFFLSLGTLNYRFSCLRFPYGHLLMRQTPHSNHFQ